MSVVEKLHLFPSGQCLEIVFGDLTDESVDAIINAANSRLLHGGGVAGSIVRRGGEIIQEESSRWVVRNGPVDHAEPATTSGGKLACRYVIHAVGPVWGSGDEDARLSAAIWGSLQRADQLGLTSVAIPPISTGIFGFPARRAAGIFFLTIEKWFTENPSSSLKLVRLVIIDRPTLEIFLTEFRPLFPQ